MTRLTPYSRRPLPRLTGDFEARAKVLWQGGLGTLRIAEMLNVDEAQVYNSLDRLKDRDAKQ